MPKVTISTPEETNKKVEKLKSYFNTTNSGIFTLGVEILNWIHEQNINQSSVISIKYIEPNGSIIIKEVPLTNLKNYPAKIYAIDRSVARYA